MDGVPAAAAGRLLTVSLTVEFQVLAEMAHDPDRLGVLAAGSMRIGWLVGTGLISAGLASLALLESVRRSWALSADELAEASRTIASGLDCGARQIEAVGVAEASSDGHL
ncbi:MAG: hypothetical protein JWO83_4052 [Caulobacteraceae bacterium]|nr:hypothetical protein [Caulobacteraceae bacterium]